MIDKISSRTGESTDMALFVQTSSYDVVKWNRDKIKEALMRETTIAPEMAHVIAIEVENMIRASKIKEITAPLIRELTNAKLVEYGFEAIRKQHARIGYPIFDVEQMITMPNKQTCHMVQKQQT
jgi:anaerobic ribonucleoside-triphosphate reductase